MDNENLELIDNQQEQSNENSNNLPEQKSEKTSRFSSALSRLKNRKVNNQIPTIKKGKDFYNKNLSYKRNKDKEPDPSLFPKKTKIIPWQEEDIVKLDTVDFDFDDILEKYDNK